MLTVIKASLIYLVLAFGIVTYRTFVIPSPMRSTQELFILDEPTEDHTEDHESCFEFDMPFLVELSPEQLAKM